MIPAIFGCSGPVLTANERAFFREADPAGYILFGRNCIDPQQLRALTDDLRSVHGRDRLLISIDQEGGRVARLRPPHWAAYPSGEAFDRLYDLAPASAIEAARAGAKAMALELSAMGITVDYHPPLDLRQPGAHDVIGDRSFGSDPMRVAAIGRAVLDGLAAGGVTGCIKHMPGHGRSMVDTHKEMPTVHESAAELEHDLAPFRALNSALIGMTGHLKFPVWDAELPATLSPTIIRDIIRGEIGFDGLLLTDDIDMEALTDTVPQRAARAHAAGCDIVLNCWAKMADMEGICAALPQISDAAAARLDRALASTHVADVITPEPAKLLAKRDALLALSGEPV
ncbi:beta-N-acetylhexosaminidase [Qipengyuania sp. ASV99]|uniref:beta-N-acetylhexosaminidase n=1 Tax=Qipengyuania sp. ASV99 TaxID=3399681 RepID=UPI003A4C7DB1